MKQYYQKLIIVPFEFGMEGPILDGSHTDQAIKVSTVTVDDFDNGFLVPNGSGGFTGPDFQEITFD